MTDPDPEIDSALFRFLERPDETALCCFTHADRPDLSALNPTLYRMFLCLTCGNKRCPKATLCDLECCGSNEPGQEGSRY